MSAEPPAAPPQPAPGPGESEPEQAAAIRDAATSALARARADARAKGLRPGSPARRQRREIPPDRRPDADRDLTTLGEQVEGFIAERGWGIDVAAGSVLGRWPQIVGPQLAAHAQAEAFEQGVLTVRASSTAWATQLRLLESTMLTAIAESVGEGVVAEVRVIGPSAPSWSRGPRQVSDGRGPRDTYG